MSDENINRTARGAAYDAPRVAEVSLDGGGNYVGPAWPERKLQSGGATISPLGGPTEIE